jgi:acyl carrier protein
MERALVRVWRDLFGEEIGTDENYFELGAHSLMLVRAHERIVSTIDPVLPMTALIKFPTVRALAAHLRTRVAPVRRADNIRSYRPSHEWAAEPSRMEAGGKAPRA